MHHIRNMVMDVVNAYSVFFFLFFCTLVVFLFYLAEYCLDLVIGASKAQRSLPPQGQSFGGNYSGMLQLWVSQRIPSGIYISKDRECCRPPL